MWYQNIGRAPFRFVTIHACDRQTNRQTDRITTPKTALAYARAVKNYRTEIRRWHGVICCATVTAATAKTTTTTTSSTAGPLDVCSRHHCTSTQRCVVGSRGRVRCVPRRRSSGSSSGRRRSPDGRCPPGFVPSRNRRRCRGTSTAEGSSGATSLDWATPTQTSRTVTYLVEGRIQEFA